MKFLDMLRALTADSVDDSTEYGVFLTRRRWEQVAAVLEAANGNLQTIAGRRKLYAALKVLEAKQ